MAGTIALLFSIPIAVILIIAIVTACSNYGRNPAAILTTTATAKQAEFTNLETEVYGSQRLGTQPVALHTEMDEAPDTERAFNSSVNQISPRGNNGKIQFKTKDILNGGSSMPYLHEGDEEEDSVRGITLQA